MRFRAFPVSVLIDGALVEPALLWATEERTEIWVAGEHRDHPRLAATFAPVAERTRAKGPVMLDGTQRKARWIAELTDGTQLPIGQAPGCGCGHPLKSWSPPAEVSA